MKKNPFLIDKKIILTDNEMTKVNGGISTLVQVWTHTIIASLAACVPIDDDGTIG